MATNLLFWAIASATSPAPESTATSKQDWSWLFRRQTFAPTLRSSSTTLTLPCEEAMCKAVSPRLFTWSRIACLSRSACDVLSQPDLAAHISGVQRSLSRVLTSEPSRVRTWQAFLCIISVKKRWVVSNEKLRTAWCVVTSTYKVKKMQSFW